ncbi:MAG: glycosyltransferase [Bacteroidota bacterium]
MKNSASISVVIPTRNRLVSLNRILDSIARQTLAPKEIIIIDSSENPLQRKQLQTTFTTIQILHSTPSVCLQRNIGIEKSNSDYIFLCDDDIELSENYCEVLLGFLESNKGEIIASGLVLENHTSNWTYSEKKPSTLGLINAYIFGLSVGFDANVPKLNNGFFTKRIISHYKNKGNSIAKSGWPIITNFDGKVFQAPIYGLGASMIRNEALKKIGFDETFYANGIGDNYDLAIIINAPVNVIKEAEAFHHREKTDRLQNEKAYYYRINALHYILLKHKRFTVRNLAYFFWSLLGKSIQFLLRANFKTVYYNLEVMLRILFNQPLYRNKN